MKLFRFILEGINFANGAIRSYRTRALLTMIGVATGIFLLTLILTMVNSLKRTLTANLASLGNTTLFVHNWPWAERGDEWYKYFNRPKVSYRDFQHLEQVLDPDEIEAMMYQVTMMGQTVKAEGRSVSNITVVGGTGGANKVRDFDFEEGRYFTDLEFRRGSNVCVVGFNIADNLYPNESAVGKFIRIRGKQLRVVGVLKKQGEALMGMGSEDDYVSIPYIVAPRIYNLNQRRIDKLIMIKLANYENMPYMESEIKGAMRAARGLKPKVEDNFSINKQEALMNSVDSVFGVMEVAGWMISLFSLLIGGFSIGNIMYISVRERTKEIGIQKALGATRSFILYQFIAESIIICLLGGLIGLGLVLGATSVIQALIASSGSTMEVYMTSYEIFLSMGLSTGIGLVAGLVPAMMASGVDPVIAIRHN